MERTVCRFFEAFAVVFAFFWCVEGFGINDERLVLDSKRSSNVYSTPSMKNPALQKPLWQTSPKALVGPKTENRSPASRTIEIPRAMKETPYYPRYWWY